MGTILVEVAEGIATVTLNRPEVRNAFDEEAIAALTGAFKTLAKDASLRAVVLRGEGKDFCAGADIRWMRRAAEYASAKNKKDAMRLVGMCRAVDECPVPVIARVQGNCFGGGVGLLAAADVGVAAQDAAFALSECRLGLLPAVVSSFILPKIGPGQARRYFLTAESFGAEDARRIGLVHEVAPEAELDARVEGLLRWILKAGPQAAREAKALVRRLHGKPLEERVRVSVAALARVRAGAECKEGLSAFLERRPASWVTEPAGPGKA